MILVLVAMACRSAGLSFLEEPRDTEQALPLVVVIHGYGDRPESMLQVLQTCQLPARIVAPRGPEPHPSGEGHAWYRVTFREDGVERDADRISRAAGPLIELIQRLQHERPAPRVVVTGFSQGGILSFLLATRFPETIDAAVPVAGALPESLLPQSAPAGAPPVRALHGSTDPLLPASDTQERVQQLAARGWDAELEVFEGVAHQITPEVRQAWCRELARALPDPEGREAR
jgi:phospholipase/carboxylesterase